MGCRFPPFLSRGDFSLGDSQPHSADSDDAALSMISHEQGHRP
jgi:hypothetical protein